MLFPIYRVRTYVPNKENGCKRDFLGCKGAKIGRKHEKTDKSVPLHSLKPLICYFRDSKSVSLFITYKKKREKATKNQTFLLKSFAVSNKSSTFAVHLRNKDAYLRHRNPYITMLRSLKCLLFGCACRHVLNTPNKPYHKGTLMILYSVSIIRFVFSVKVKKRKSGCMLIAVVLII